MLLYSSYSLSRKVLPENNVEKTNPCVDLDYLLLPNPSSQESSSCPKMYFLEASFSKPHSTNHQAIHLWLSRIFYSPIPPSGRFRHFRNTFFLKKVPQSHFEVTNTLVVLFDLLLPNPSFQQNSFFLKKASQSDFNATNPFVVLKNLLLPNLSFWEASTLSESFFLTESSSTTSWNDQFIRCPRWSFIHQSLVPTEFLFLKKAPESDFIAANPFVHLINSLLPKSSFWESSTFQEYLFL